MRTTAIVVVAVIVLTVAPVQSQEARLVPVPASAFASEDNDELSLIGTTCLNPGAYVIGIHTRPGAESATASVHLSAEDAARAVVALDTTADQGWEWITLNVTANRRWEWITFSGRAMTRPGVVRQGCYSVSGRDADVQFWRLAVTIPPERQPRVLRNVSPRYTAQAMRTRLQGTVLVEAIVLPNGSVGDVTVIRSLDSGLDEEAIKAARQMRFEPGTRFGEPAAIAVALEFEFTLR